MSFVCWLSANKNGVLILLLSLVLIWYIAFSQIRIVFVNTCSVPYKVCLQFYNLQPKKGDLCVFDFLGKSFVKYIAGTSGDEISIVDNDVYVGSTHIGKISNASKLHPITLRKIPEGYVFMSGTHVYSFDSRYKEFGLIPISQIQGKAIGLLRW